VERITARRTLACVADHQTYDRVAAVCRIGCPSVGDMMGAVGVSEGGKGKASKVF
jgi:hypothetical protein